MSRFVLVFRGTGDIPQEELRLICEHAKARILDTRASKSVSKSVVVEVEGPADDLLADVKKSNQWIASEQRTYKLA